MIKFVLLAVIASCLFSGCCATGADDTVRTQQATRINLPE